MGKRGAFTLLELVFVIVILGIVSAISAEIIAQVYKSYILQRAAHRSSIKTELALTQIANRLSEAVPRSIIGRKTSDGAYSALSDITTTDYDILEWVGIDYDSFIYYNKDATSKVAWSGVADLDALGTTKTSILSPGSDLSKADTISSNLSLGGLSRAVLLFSGEYDAYSLGFGGIGSSTAGVVNIDRYSGSTFQVPDLTGRTIADLYYLASSAYAIVPQNNGDGTFDLFLHRGYRPWQGESYTNDTNPSLLLENVTSFKFQGNDAVVRVKICQRSTINSSKHIHTCKEKVVLR